MKTKVKCNKIISIFLIRYLLIKGQKLNKDGKKYIIFLSYCLGQDDS